MCDREKKMIKKQRWKERLIKNQIRIRKNDYMRTHERERMIT